MFSSPKKLPKFRKLDSNNSFIIKSKTSLSQIFNTNKKLILVSILISFILSLIRAILVDPSIVIIDGYEFYTTEIEKLLTNNDYDIDANVVDYRHKLRIIYSLLIAITFLLTSVTDIIFIGRVISFIAFLFAIYFLSKLLDNFETLSDSRNKTPILILFILNPTVITNIVRFETDILFLAISFFVLYKYSQLYSTEVSKINIIELLLAIMLLFFTRETGALLILILFFHFMYKSSKKIQSVIIILGGILLIISIILDVFSNILFNAIYSTTTAENAFEIVYNGNFLIIIDIIISKFVDPYIVLKTMESIFYSFFPVLLFAIIGVFAINSNCPIKLRKLISHEISFYFISFLVVYIIFRTGRGLDRFWLPILVFPLFMLPYAPDIKDLFNNFKVIQDKQLIKRIQLAFALTSNYSLKNMKEILQTPKSTFYFILTIQLSIYLVRTTLSYFIQ